MDAYWYKLYDFWERHGSYSCYGQIKANSTAIKVNATNINTKGNLPNRQISLPLHTLFL